MLLPIQIPAGVYRDGSAGQSRGRWKDANLVRGYGNDIGPVLGWRAHSPHIVSGRARAMYIWAEDAATRRIGIGTHTNLYVMDAAGLVHDITPVGFVSGVADAAQNTGFGGGAFGSGTFGTPRLDVGTYAPVSVWTLDNYGKILLGCMAGDGNIYMWENDTGVPATVVTNAPTSCLGVLTTADRFVFALGANGDARVFAWSDQEDLETWAPSDTNQAGDLTLDTDGKIITATELRSGTLILTDVDAHIARYEGLPFVFGVDKIGSGCGANSVGCVANLGDSAIWWGKSGFWRFDGGLTTVSCDIGNLQELLNPAQRSKIACFHNVRYSEIWWFYPSTESNENDSYVAYNYRTNQWWPGSIVRLSGAAQGIFNYPMTMTLGGEVMEHEVGASYDEVMPFARSGPIELGDGRTMMRVTSIMPDMAAAQDAQVRFYTRPYPMAAETTIADVSLTDRGIADLRFTAREVEMRVDFGASAGRWGLARLEASPAGRR